MFENCQKLVSTEKLFALFLRISLMHEIKQNEKYQYALQLCLLKIILKLFKSKKNWKAFIYVYVNVWSL